MDFGDFMMAPPSQEVELDRKLYTMLEIEAKRYQNFFATLDEQRTGRLPREVALAFYAKSSLSEQEIAQMYALIKTLQLLPDADAMNETEFTTGMHFIVCITKRNLAKLPPTFPTYLFPTLDLTPRAASTAISSMPSPDKDELQSRAPGFSDGGSALGATPTAAHPPAQIERLADSTSLQQLLERQTHNERATAGALARADASSATTLASLRGCLEQLADGVEALGYPVPAPARALEALDDLGNLLRSHVQAARQEIQSLEISAQMLRVAAESAGAESSSGSGGGGSDDDPFGGAARLTQELAALQQQAAQLAARKRELLARKQQRALGAAPASGTKAPESAAGAAAGSLELRSSESVESAASDPFAAFAAAPVAPVAAPAAASGDFSWGDFS